MKKFFAAVILLCLLMSVSYADTVWILCQPDSYVNTRPFANKKHNANGYMECGWEAETTGKTSKGYLYLELNNEDGYGWVHKGYIVYSEPIIITFKTNIYSKGRVACWRSIGGNRRCWVKNGDVVTVYALCEEWAVTNKGFIKTEYLGVDYDRLAKTRLENGQSNDGTDELHWDDD